MGCFFHSCLHMRLLCFVQIFLELMCNKIKHLFDPAGEFKHGRELITLITCCLVRMIRIFECIFDVCVCVCCSLCRAKRQSGLSQSPRCVGGGGGPRATVEDELWPLRLWSSHRLHLSVSNPKAASEQETAALVFHALKARERQVSLAPSYPPRLLHLHRPWAGSVPGAAGAPAGQDLLSPRCFSSSSCCSLGSGGVRGFSSSSVWLIEYYRHWVQVPQPPSACSRRMTSGNKPDLSSVTSGLRLQRTKAEVKREEVRGGGGRRPEEFRQRFMENVCEPYNKNLWMWCGPVENQALDGWDAIEAINGSKQQTVGFSFYCCCVTSFLPSGPNTPYTHTHTHILPAATLLVLHTHTHICARAQSLFHGHNFYARTWSGPKIIRLILIIKESIRCWLMSRLWSNRHSDRFLMLIDPTFNKKKICFNFIN